MNVTRVANTDELRRAVTAIDLLAERPAEVGSEATYEEVASLIVGGKAPPQWLQTFFKRWIACLALDRGVHSMAPTKSAMKKRLEEIRSAALLLQSSLSDNYTREFLEAGHGGPIEGKAALGSQLGNLVESAKHAAELPELSTETGKVKSGRGRALCPGAFPPKVFCAALIAETWKYVRGEYPAPRNVQAACAAQALWLASKGQLTGWGDSPVTGWRSYFARIEDPGVTAIRAEIRRHLALTEEWG
jgi:hypothetical protein